MSKHAEGARLAGHWFFCETDLLALAYVLLRLRRCLYDLPMSPFVGLRARRSHPLRTWQPHGWAYTWVAGARPQPLIYERTRRAVDTHLSRFFFFQHAVCASQLCLESIFSLKMPIWALILSAAIGFDFSLCHVHITVETWTSRRATWTSRALTGDHTSRWIRLQSPLPPCPLSSFPGRLRLPSSVPSL